MNGMRACIKARDRFSAHVMIGPSPCYVTDGDYESGFSRADCWAARDDGSDYLGWSSNMAPANVGSAEQPEVAVELTNSFCPTDPDIARHFAHVTFSRTTAPTCPSSRLRCAGLGRSTLVGLDETRNEVGRTC